ncbi:MAG: hypothetical protein ACJ735_03635 [Actinomycetes bacterium]
MTRCDQPHPRRTVMTVQAEMWVLVGVLATVSFSALALLATALFQTRSEMREGFRDLRAEMHAGFSELRGDIRELRDRLTAAGA